MSKSYQVCCRCVMDTSVTNITFDEQGICNYCTEFLKDSEHILHKESVKRKQELDVFISKIKSDGEGKQYDCVVGVSGGVDSSWCLVQAVKLGLRPLAVHMDNGWNSELAQNNIENLVRGLGVDLHTHVIDWDEYRNLMQAFFDADVIDVELLYDNALLGVNFEQAARHRTKYILSGSNQATEGMKIPKGWNWFKQDKKNIVAIAKQFGEVKLQTFPAFSTIDYIWYEFIRNIHWIPFIDYFEYNKSEVVEALVNGYGYKPYPYKHYESIFTRFYQGYILPEKFGVDKRRVHLGTLVAVGQMSREEAIKGLEGIPYPSQKALDDDKQYFIKKMGWTFGQLEEYISRAEIPHNEYPSEKPLWDQCVHLYRTLLKWFPNLKF
jgi:N-acetyl sugar amidotransferase